MPRSLSLLLLMLVVTIAISCPKCSGQPATRDELVDRIADGSDVVFVMNDLNVVQDDIARLLNDAGFGGLETTVRKVLGIDSMAGLSAKAGLIWYMQGRRFDRVEEFRIDDRQKLLARLEIDQRRPIADAEMFELDPDMKPLNDLGNLLGERNSNAVISGHRLLIFGQDEALARTLLTTLPLARKLDDTCREIVNSAGIVLIGQVNRNQIESAYDLPAFLDNYSGRVTESEQQWLHDFAEVVSTARLGLLAMKYHDRVLQFRSRVLMDPQKSFDGLVDFSLADRDWRPELGLEPDQLVLSAALQMDAFRSSAAARIVPQVLLAESGRGQQLEFLNGNMLRILAELSGDSWNDLTAARVGLYQNDPEEQNGQLAIVGIADARNPEDVLTELRRLSRLTSPEALSVKAADREDELLRLVDELISDDPNISSRAETRLVLAGQAAVPALEKGASAWNPALRQRAERILKRISDDSGAAGKNVVDPGFWTTLNPGLRLEESTAQVAGFTTHTIHVTPDPSKDQDEVANATQVMKHLFGENWNAIQVVQVRDHFVFMLGSDGALLERIVSNVDGGQSILTKPLRDAGLPPVRGQIQACFNTARVMDLLGMQNWLGGDGRKRVGNDHCWIGLDFDPHAASADALVPVGQVIPFAVMGMGF